MGPERNAKQVQEIGLLFVALLVTHGDFKQFAEAQHLTYPRPDQLGHSVPAGEVNYCKVSTWARDFVLNEYSMFQNPAVRRVMAEIVEVLMLASRLRGFLDGPAVASILNFKFDVLKPIVNDKAF